jgi:predicted phosphodiesterase
MLKKYRLLAIVFSSFIGNILFIGGCATVRDLSRAQGGQASTIVKGPYLLYPGDNTEMTLLWQADSTISCQLSWGLDTTYSAGSTLSFEYGTDHQHRYTFTGLAPGQKYYYRLAAGQSAYTGSFRTAPPADATSVEFFAYGDTRTNPDKQDMVCSGIISAYAAEPISQTLILHVGDWVSHDSENAWASEFFDRTYSSNITMQANLPIQGCMGNHEGNGTIYAKYWTYPYLAKYYWSFDYGPAHIAIVDQYANYSAGSAQLTWLESDLASSTKKWKFILLHEPGWSAGSFRGNNKEVQADIQPLCEKYGVQIVFAGHNHYYSRAVVNGVQHLAIGTGGAPAHTPKPSQPNVISTYKGLGYCKIKISSNTLNFEMLSSPSNTVIDSFTTVLPQKINDSEPRA